MPRRQAIRSPRSVTITALAWGGDGNTIDREGQIYTVFHTLDSIGARKTLSLFHSSRHAGNCESVPGR